jgi:hypothetical protein
MSREDMGFFNEPAKLRATPRLMVRAALLLVGVLALGTAFTAAYVGALHKPTPRDVPLAVVAGDQGAAQVTQGIRQQSKAVQSKTYKTRGDADDALKNRKVYGVLVSGPQGLSLDVAGGAANGGVSTVQTAVETAAKQANLPVQVQDRFPLTPEDPRGLSAFYMIVGLMVTGYLGSTVLSIFTGTVPPSVSRVGLRIAGLAGLAVAAGLAAAALTVGAYGIWPGQFWAVAGTAMLVTFAASVAAAGIQAWLGTLGTGLVLLLFVVLGNPGSGGVFAPELLPGFFRGMHTWVLPGLGTDLARSAVYFGGTGVGGALLGLVVYIVLGVGLLFGAFKVFGHRPAAGQP